MNDRPIFVIGEQHAGRDIFNIARALNINQNSPAEDILKIIEAIQHKVGELDIAEKYKKRIVNQIEGAKIELEDEKPDKKSIAESIKKTTEILKEAKTTGETLLENTMDEEQSKYKIEKREKWIWIRMKNIGKRRKSR